MLISDKYSEYGVTGAFFWVTQLFVILILSERPLAMWSTWMGEINPFFMAVPEILKVSIAGVLAALGIMAIFVTGLLLDLFGSYQISPEIFIFRHQVEKNLEWLNSFVEENKSFIGKDFNDFLSHPEDFWKIQRDFWGIQADVFLLRRLRKKSKMSSPIASINSLKFSESYNRLQSLLISYCSVNTNTSNLNAFYDQVHLWRTSKAISFAVMLTGYEIALVFCIKTIIRLFYLLLHGLWSAEESRLLFRELTSYYVWLLATMIFFVIIYYFSVIITNQSYSRMCSNLFALIYFLEKIEQGKDKQQSMPLSEDAGIA
jgi:hypothetical protein